MAKPVSAEELQLRKRARRRLVGALVLVAAVAAILPMVLDSEPRPTSREVNIQIPSPDAKGGFVSKVVPLPAGKSSDAVKGAKPAGDIAVVDAPPSQTPEKVVATAPEKPKDVPAVPATKPKPDPVSAKATPPKAAPPQVAEAPAAIKPAPGTFFIQVIALVEADKAKEVQQKIIDAGMRSYTEVVAAAVGKVTRVRAGPFASRDEAEQARTKLKGLGFEGNVAAH